ncbi:bifunctional hydroxymethylpyrimidine kinase/phosphomethylpyrimidine kinase [Archaeoglobus neptunius]|uniref:bifunctional hydroxymethylpyrimidine kinase/phosphomethylpyrimidine kinase n=1 Tax=Archaeoglobus neptunius TaxID=2798580 RepID=UPI0019280483|nr:hydroxymethylpyrimidine/phosphomethylpyrimidine kinase [Archaeoglobus neptunius]
MPRTILTISGLDPCGGAGIHADIKTARAIGLHSASVITALTVQNTCAAKSVYPVDSGVIREQIRDVLDDIGIDCIKIGLVPSLDVAEAISNEIEKLEVPKVLDPVVFAGAGGKLGERDAYVHLLRYVDLVTPNLSEARIITSARSPEELALTIFRNYGCNVVITGGEMNGKDIICENGRIYTVTAEFSPVNIHGTGCVYSTSLACYLGMGYGIEDAVRKARVFVLESVKKALRPGKCFPVVNP